MEPLVSILIPAYNAERWIADTIQSALAQTWPRKEIIVVEGKERIQSLIRYTPWLRLLLGQIRRRIDSVYGRLNVTNSGKLTMSRSTRDFLLSYYADESARLKERLS